MDFFEGHLSDLEQVEKILNTEIGEYVLAAENNGIPLVEHSCSRIKTEESIRGKLKRKGLGFTFENAIHNCSDLVGIRYIVHFIGDIYAIRNVIREAGFEIVCEKDYIKHPKQSGYRGYHMVLMVPVGEHTYKAEIQIRTEAMDCWATLEHQLRYKQEWEDLRDLDGTFRQCSDVMFENDVVMEAMRIVVNNPTSTIRTLFQTKN